MRKAWFCYQLGADHPVPVIIYDSIPDNKNFLRPSIIQQHELSEAHGRDQDGEVMTSFSMLMTEFPYTGDAYALGPKINLDQRDVLLDATNALLKELGPAELR